MYFIFLIASFCRPKVCYEWRKGRPGQYPASLHCRIDSPPRSDASSWATNSASRQWCMGQTDPSEINCVNRWCCYLNHSRSKISEYISLPMPIFSSWFAENQAICHRNSLKKLQMNYFLWRWFLWGTLICNRYSDLTWVSWQLKLLAISLLDSSGRLKIKKTPKPFVRGIYHSLVAILYVIYKRLIMRKVCPCHDVFKNIGKYDPWLHVRTQSHYKTSHEISTGFCCDLLWLKFLWMYGIDLPIFFFK